MKVKITTSFTDHDAGKTINQIRVFEDENEAACFVARESVAAIKFGFVECDQDSDDDGFNGTSLVLFDEEANSSLVFFSEFQPVKH